MNDICDSSLAEDLVIDIYEQIFHELYERGEVAACHSLLTSCVPLSGLRYSSPLSATRYRRMEGLLDRTVASSELYRGETRQSVRRRLADSVCSSLQEVPSGRLLTLIRNALKWEQLQGTIPTSSCRVNLLTGESLGSLENETPVRSITRTRRFPTGCFPECFVFSRDGSLLITGSSDGLIEVWNTDTDDLSMDLEYQAAGNFMVHQSSVTGIDLSHDGKLLCTGDKDGRIKVWALNTGKIHRDMKTCHRDTVTSLSFSEDDTQVLSSSLDCSVMLHGLMSGRLLQEWKGHESFVTKAGFLDSSKICTTSSDGFLRIFSASSTTALLSLPISNVLPKEISEESNAPVSINNFLFLKRSQLLLVCPNGTTGCVLGLDGTLVKCFKTEKLMDRFVNVTTSPSENLIYFASQLGNVYCFSSTSGELLNVVQVTDGEVTCISHHPRKLLLAVSSTNGALTILSR